MKKITLKDGTIVILRPLRKKEDARKFLRYINALVAEKASTLVDRPLSLKEEKAWLKETYAKISHGDEVMIVAEHGGEIAALFAARKGRLRERGNISLALSVAKKFREKGLGEILLRKIITEAKKKLNPDKIYLMVMEGNLPAQRLYTKVGFVKRGVIPDWAEWRGRMRNNIYMVLRK